QAIEISKRVESLQDSLEASNLQLTQLKRIVTTGDDTTLSESTADRQALKGGDQKSSEPDHPSVVISGQDVLLAKNELVLYDLFENDPSFPTDFPLEGTLTRQFNPEQGHFGIDIATSEGVPFKAIAD